MESDAERRERWQDLRKLTGHTVVGWRGYLDAIFLDELDEYYQELLRKAQKARAKKYL